MSRDDKARRELYPLISEAIEKGYADLGCGFDISVAQAITPNMYNALMREGYRKASEVAREIFEDINEFKKQWVSGDMNDDEFCKHLYKLEKKYTEGDG